MAEGCGSRGLHMSSSNQPTAQWQHAASGVCSICRLLLACYTPVSINLLGTLVQQAEGFDRATVRSTCTHVAVFGMMLMLTQAVGGNNKGRGDDPALLLLKKGYAVDTCMAP